MGLFIARISGGAGGVLLALFAFILRILVRRSKLPLIWLRLLSAAGVLGGAYIIFATVRNLLRYSSGVSSLITVSAPFLAFVLALSVHFLVLLLNAQNPGGWRIPYSCLVTAILASVQLALALSNLGRNWNNLTRGGMKEYLYIQFLALGFIIIDALLFWIGFLKTRGFIQKAGAASPALSAQTPAQT